jgi:hypothetical protein
VEQSLMKAADQEGVKIVEFTVAPLVNALGERPFHEWFIEFEHGPRDLAHFAHLVDVNLRERNIYYRDLLAGNILQELKIRPVRKNGFIDYMKSVGRLGGQNKVPRLSNDRKIAEGLAPYLLQP